jgi:hypothetical protein
VSRVTRRLFPLIAAAGLIAIGMITTTWGPGAQGRTAWALPDDLWGTMTAAQRLLHLQLSGLYTKPTSLIAFPGAALVLVPVVALIDAAGLPLQMQSAHNPDPVSWLLAGPYETAISAVALFAADSLAERLGVSRPRRALLALAGATALWSVSVRWGHPEDAVAVGLLLYGTGALPRARAGWLAGAAIAVQPLVLLVLPVLVVAVVQDGTYPGLRRVPGFLFRAAVPSAVTLGAAAAANWHATVSSVISQPNSTIIDHPTPWASLAPHLSDGNIAAGPGRVLAIAAACGCAVVFARGGRAAPPPAGPRPAAGRLAELLWWVAAALAMRSLFESVMVAYYLWPTLAVALIVASARWSRLIMAAVITTAVTFGSQLPWHSPWGWWTPMVAGLALTLWLAWPAPSGADGDQAAVGEIRPGLRSGLER